MKTIIILACLLVAGLRTQDNDQRYTVFVPTFAGGDSGLAWDEAVAMVGKCRIESVAQFHSLRVNLWMTEGAALYTIEPYPDAIIDAIRDLAPPCEIRVMSE